MTLLDKVLVSSPPPFALLQRGEGVDVLLGDMSEVDTLANLPLRTHGTGHDVLALLPYRQIAERGYTVAHDDTPLLALSVSEQDVVSVREVLRRIPDVPITLAEGAFDIDDEEYADIVRRVIADEIGAGKGANFVIKRSFTSPATPRPRH